MEEEPSSPEIFEEFIRRFAPPEIPTIETILTGEDYFGLSTAMPLQRAICRVIDGQELGELATIREVREAFKVSSMQGGYRPKEFVLVAAIRSAKSMIAAAAALRMALTCDLSILSDGEIPRVSILSLSKEIAQPLISHLIGNMLTKPELKKYCVEEPKSDSCLIQRPDGWIVEIKVVAGARAGGTLVARWSAGIIYDEATRMVGVNEGVVNLEDSRDAAIGRLLPGAQMLHIGSPWAPFGPVYNWVKKRHGKPADDLIVCVAAGYNLNNVWWTPERCEALKRTNPTAYRTDVEANFADAENSMFPLVSIEKCTREEEGNVPPNFLYDYVACMDPATRGNAWTLVIGTKEKDGTISVCRHKQWVGSKLSPLSPDAVLREISSLCNEYSLSVVRTDQYAYDAYADIARNYNLALDERTWTAERKKNLFKATGTFLDEGRMSLPPDDQIHADLLAVQKVVTQQGWSVSLPQTSDGRHCDYAPAIAMLVEDYIDEPRPKETNKESLWSEEEIRMLAMVEADSLMGKDHGYGHMGQVDTNDYLP